MTSKSSDSGEPAVAVTEVWRVTGGDFDATGLQMMLTAAGVSVRVEDSLTGHDDQLPRGLFNFMGLPEDLKRAEQQITIYLRLNLERFDA
jgi:hypothetical protein